MPLHVAAISRRRFLAHSAAAVASLAALPSGWGAESTNDPNFFALLSDTHIPETPEVEARGVNMTANLKQVVRELEGLETKPAAAFINGDCAYLRGLPADYANLAECLAPLGPAGIPLHLTMGNHDDRGPFYDALANQRPETPLVEAKHVGIVESPHANWFLLDSLFEVNVVTGELGEQQLTWLGRALDARKDKPAIVMAHHTPQFEPPPEGQKWGGIRDTSRFFEVLAARPHVKAFVYGHSHNWDIQQRNKLHLINLPPVAYVFGEVRPKGWVMANLKPDGVRLELRSLDPAHAQHGKPIELKWQ